jgi:hypothetical protein
MSPTVVREPCDAVPPEPGFARREVHNGDPWDRGAERRLLKRRTRRYRPRGEGSGGNQGFPPC